MIKQIIAQEHLEKTSWQEFWSFAQKKLSPDQLKVFVDAHRMFVEYPSKTNLIRFYSIIYQHHLVVGWNGFRLQRLCDVYAMIKPAFCAMAAMNQTQTIIDVGCGSGLFAKAVSQELHVNSQDVYVYDLCAPAVDYVTEKWGVQKWSVPIKADLMLCIDSLGEIHSDQDEELRECVETGSDEDIFGLLEGHYGLISKLSDWLRFLDLHGTCLLTEPLPYRRLASILKQELEKQNLTVALYENNTESAVSLHQDNETPYTWVMSIGSK